jgi:hypothetical protein
MTCQRIAKILLILIAAWGIFITTLVAFAVYPNEENPDNRAILSMGISLILIWCVCGGILMRWKRDLFVGWMKKISWGWRLRFVLLCILMAMLEEAVTTSLTNMAPLFGGVTDAARITASKNYFEVIFMHSVIAFVPMFICWAWLLSRYKFMPVEVMLLFGLTGTLAESITFGLQHLPEVGMWTYVYGLMVYLPAHSVPAEREGYSVQFYHWLLAVFLPLFFIIPFVVYLGYTAMKILWSFMKRDR